MAAVSVATTVTRIDTVDETDSQGGSVIAIYNNGAATVYLQTGRASTGLTTSTGYPLAAGQAIKVRFDDAGQGVWGIVASGAVEVRTLELGVA